MPDAITPAVIEREVQSGRFYLSGSVFTGDTTGVNMRSVRVLTRGRNPQEYDFFLQIVPGMGGGIEGRAARERRTVTVEELRRFTVPMDPNILCEEIIDYLLNSNLGVRSAEIRFDRDSAKFKIRSLVLVRGGGSRMELLHVIFCMQYGLAIGRFNRAGDEVRGDPDWFNEYGDFCIDDLDTILSYTGQERGMSVMLPKFFNGRTVINDVSNMLSLMGSSLVGMTTNVAERNLTIYYVAVPGIPVLGCIRGYLTRTMCWCDEGCQLLSRSVIDDECCIEGRDSIYMRAPGQDVHKLTITWPDGTELTCGVRPFKERVAEYLAHSLSEAEYATLYMVLEHAKGNMESIPEYAKSMIEQLAPVLVPTEA